MAFRELVCYYLKQSALSFFFPGVQKPLKEGPELNIEPEYHRDLRLGT